MGDSTPVFLDIPKRYRSRELIDAISETNVAEVAAWWPGNNGVSAKALGRFDERNSRPGSISIIGLGN